MRERERGREGERFCWVLLGCWEKVFLLFWKAKEIRVSLFRVFTTTCALECVMSMMVGCLGAWVLMI